MLRRLPLLVLIFVLASSSFAAVVQKFNAPLGVSGAASAARRAALSRVYAFSPERETVRLLVKLSPGASPEALRRLDPRVRLGARAGQVVTAEAPLSVLPSLAGLEEVERVALASRTKPRLDVVRSNAMNGPDYLGVLAGPGDGTASLGSWDGAGVVVGIVDTGLDVRHPDFIVGAGTAAVSRVLALWDQTANGSAPAGFGYGAELGRNALTAALRTGSPSTLGIDAIGHGTAVAGCAAGSDGPSGKFTGLAPRADIVAVKTDFSEAGIVDGVAYVFQKAAALGRPAVVNLSLGTHLGPHDGSDAFESALASLAGPGRLITAAAGNEGAARVHAAIDVPRWSNASVAITAPGSDPAVFADFWHSSGDAYTVQVATAPGGAWLSVPSGGQASQALGAAVIEILNDAPGQAPGAGGAKEIEVIVTGEGGPAPAGLIIAFTRTVNLGDGHLDGWTGPDSAAFADHADPGLTVGEPATSPAVIAVGAYVARLSWPNAAGGFSTSGAASELGGLASFSSLGPSRDGRLKPDLSAPGRNVAAPLSSAAPSPGPAWLTPDLGHAVVSGTSFAAPVTAGALALLLQQNPSLTPDQARTLLQSRARGDTRAAGLPNDAWGAGKLLGAPPSTLSAPELSAAAASTGSMRWSWSGTPGAFGYRLLSPSGANLSGDLPPNVFVWVQAGLSPNVARTARLEAFGADGAADSAYMTRSTLAQTPPAPSAAALSSAAASMAWDAGGNPAGTAYELDLSSDPAFAIGVSTYGPLAQPSATLSGLEESATYYLRARAFNGDGVPTAYGPSAAIVTPKGAPYAATGLSGTALWDGSILWSWSANRLASGYLVARVGEPPMTTSSTSFVERGLPPNAARTISVQAVNDVGGAPVSTSPVVYSIAAAPASIALADVGVATAAVSWSANGNPPGTRYVAELVGASAVSTAATSAVFYGLAPNTAYLARVRALNGDGIATDYAGPIGIVTMAAPPGSPYFVSATTSAMTIAWRPNGNPPDTLYEYACSTGVADAAWTPAPAGGALVSGLVPGRTYTVRVRAVGRGGLASAEASSPITLIPTSVPRLIDPAEAPSIALGNVRLDVPPAAFAQTVNLTVALPASVPAPASAAAPLGATGVAVDITTDKGLQPLKPLSLAVTYTDVQLAGGDPSRLVIARFDPASGLWIPIASSPDPVHHRVSAALEHLSLYQLMTVVPAASLSAVNVFPNPVYSSRGQKMTFANLPAGATLSLYTLAGRKVRRLDADGSGLAVWDARNEAGLPVASGVYFVLVEGGGSRTILKAMVER